MAREAAFRAHQVSWPKFLDNPQVWLAGLPLSAQQSVLMPPFYESSLPQMVVGNPMLVARLGNRFYPWHAAAAAVVATTLDKDGKKKKVYTA
jgi:hypothetical protein